MRHRRVGDYGNNERCTISAATALYAFYFRTENRPLHDGQDYVTIGGTRYMGSLPTSMAATWYSDHSVTRGGWIICGTTTPAVLPPPSSSSGNFCGQLRRTIGRTWITDLYAANASIDNFKATGAATRTARRWAAVVWVLGRSRAIAARRSRAHPTPAAARATRFVNACAAAAVRVDRANVLLRFASLRRLHWLFRLRAVQRQHPRPVPAALLRDQWPMPGDTAFCDDSVRLRYKARLRDGWHADQLLPL